MTGAGRGDANRGDETSAPVKDGVGEAGVHAGSFRATCLACRSQQRERVALERGSTGSGLGRVGLRSEGMGKTAVFGDNYRKRKRRIGSVFLNI